MLYYYYYYNNQQFILSASVNALSLHYNLLLMSYDNHHGIYYRQGLKPHYFLAVFKNETGQNTLLCHIEILLVTSPLLPFGVTATFYKVTSEKCNHI